ncbi:beta-glucosidase [Pseudoduganella umbonata]|uniref:Beta-glucosidase n=1 Tax=Pseudoduganella umbonata TaxID=864828 RepID=A0A4P8HVV6_9BURK|nr:glycoside hydrolase family 3 C-terminal domain-containing protein [Pseudoduganella umbonata]MBB3221993.1 beta-glucosidase [Pseudoduganella umbonata]QCP14217.1 beta-glucosidase [Pseudoduganella umbonata]
MTKEQSRELTVAEMATLTAGATMWTTPAIPDAGIASLSMADGPMGVAGARIDERDVSLLTPAPMALGASWDPALVQRVGRLVGGEAVRRGVDLMLAPNLNLARSPLAGRAFEYFSEDPLLCGTLGAAWVQGCQAAGTGAIAKHLVCNDSETERDRMNAVVDERTLREVYLLPFEMAAQAGCAGMLTAYNRINGQWCAEAGPVVRDIVKDEWRFPGVFMSDWFGTHSTAASLNGGLDLEMPGPARFLGARSASAVAEGQVPLERLQDAARRVAAAARRFGAEKGQPLDDGAATALLVEAAAAGFTLVRNEGGLLPLDPARAQRIAVIGPNASAPCFQGGTFAKIAVKPDAVLPIDALRARFGAAIDSYTPGVDPQPKLPRMPVRPARMLADGCTRGMTIDYFDNADFAGPPLLSETRDTNSLTWFHGVHEAGALQADAGTRASGIFTATETGQHRFHVGGTGALRLLVDGVEVFRRDEQLAPGDVMGRLKSGDADSVGIVLEAGRAVDVVVELRYTAARCQGLWYGVRAPGTAEAMLADAVQAARDADAVILVVGETSDASVESKDRADTCLPAEQLVLIERVCAANPRTVVVTNVGHAFDTRWEGQAAAVLHCWYPGQEFGNALAQVLAGDREPGGRMPVTIARNDGDYPALSLRPDAQGDLHYSDGVRFGYRGLAARGIAPRQAFGGGFGYAAFHLRDACVRATGDGCELTVTLRNTSTRAGAEVVQVYRTVPELTLAGYAKVWLEAGAATNVVIPIPLRRLQVWRAGWHTLEGPVHLLVGHSSADLPLSVSITLQGDAS